jgi:uncharacterized protein YkwD
MEKNERSRWADMARGILTLVLLCFGLAACDTNVSTTGTSGQKIYRIYGHQTDRIQLRMLDSVNSLRAAAGVAPVELDAQLTAAAATHARDMALQNRPWHFGSDGSSPIDRIQRLGYGGSLVGETISETYETELETLAAWMEAPETRGILLDSAANDMGFSWHQEENGKIWWTLVMGQGAAAILAAS